MNFSFCQVCKYSTVSYSKRYCIMRRTVGVDYSYTVEDETTVATLHIILRTTVATIATVVYPTRSRPVGYCTYDTMSYGTVDVLGEGAPSQKIHGSINRVNLSFRQSFQIIQCPKIRERRYSLRVLSPS